jgi:hypothetical protein
MSFNHLAYLDQFGQVRYKLNNQPVVDDEYELESE